MLEGAQVVIRNTTFENNYVGWYVPPSSNPGQNVQTVNLINQLNNRFEKTDNLKDPYPGQTPGIGNSTYGILLNDLASINIGYNISPDLGQLYCVFDGLKYGIKTNYCNLEVGGCGFVNCDVGIRATGNGHQLIQNGSTLAMFDNCGAGVEVDQMNATIRNNYMTNMEYGVKIENTFKKKIFIENNDIAASTGIYIFNGLPNKGLIQNNAIESEYQGILGFETNYLNNRPWEILDNTITLTSGAVNGTGILFWGGERAKIKDNTLNGSSEENQGIVLAGHYRPLIEDNNIYGEEADCSASFAKGIFLFGCDKSVVSCNYVNNTRFGIAFWGLNEGTDLRGNILNTHCEGLILGNEDSGDGNAFIGTQEHRGNNWAILYEDNDPDDIGAKHLGGTNLIVQQSQFNVDDNTSTGGLPQFLPRVALEPGITVDWFDLENSQEKTYCCDEGGPNCLTSLAKEGYDYLDRKIAADSLATDGFEGALSWSASYHLQQRLKEEENISALDSVYIKFYNRMDTLSVGAFTAMRDSINSVFAIDSTTEVQLQFQIDTIANGLAELVHIDSLIEADSTQLDTLTVQKMQLLNNLQNSAADYTATVNTVKENRQNRARDLATPNNLLPADSVYEANAKSVNELFLELLERDTLEFTASEKLTLSDIANQCPLSGGDAVFLARALLADTITYDDGASCLTAQSNSAENGEDANIQLDAEQLLKLYPNPAKNELILEWVDVNQKRDQEGELVMLNTNGQSVLNRSVDLSNFQARVNVSNLPAGIYFIHITLDGEKVLLEKVTLIK